jgi:hypothetical protein
MPRNGPQQQKPKSTTAAGSLPFQEVDSRSSTWLVRISTISLASWFVSRGRFGRLDIGRRGLLACLVIVGDAANDAGEAGIYI